MDNYLRKYKKYKQKYLNLTIQYGKGKNYSWYIISDTEKREATPQEEFELEQKYNKASETTINFNGVNFIVAENGDYIYEKNILKREEKLTNIDCNEYELFNELKKCALECGAVLRVAGGWVRDKILKKSNDDIDIAVENMSGRDFSMHLSDYIKKLSNGWNCSSISIIAANAEKSKNLETATLKIKIPNGVEFELDFVGLRTEVYDLQSRVPIVIPATPEEDAKRRDLTINALFYNINENRIEDYVGGIKDIFNGIIRTPLDPLKTFRDDPLRILRALRFLSRFGFTLDNSIKLAMQKKELRDRLSNKKIISRERIGAELLGFFKTGSNPKLAFNEIYNNGLWFAIFGFEEISDWGRKSIDIINRLTNLSQNNILTALTLPLFEVDKLRKLGKKEKSHLQNLYSINLCITHKFADINEEIHNCIFDLQNLPKDKKLWKRSTIALIVKDVLKNDLYSNVIEIGKIVDHELFLNVENFIVENNLQNCYLVKLDGREIIKLFKEQVEKKDYDKLFNILLAWQLDNPEKTFDYVIQNKDYFISELKK
jgi:tRNA nucleotidyltransferase/poly(A) polymerase